MKNHPNSRRAELGQNFLIDRRSIAHVVDAVRATSGPIVEIGAGDGALTRPMSTMGRDVLAIEIDSEYARRLGAANLPGVTVIAADALRTRYPRSPFVVVGNLPFHVTTPLLRMLLETPNWTDAVLVAQWEVARRRTGNGGASLLTASWWPWFEFALHGRIPARAFRPVPAVDAGSFTIHRREAALVGEGGPASGVARSYRRFVGGAYRARGRGMFAILRTLGVSTATARKVLAARRIDSRALPRDLGPEDWVALWKAWARV